MLVLRVTPTVMWILLLALIGMLKTVPTLRRPGPTSSGPPRVSLPSPLEDRLRMMLVL